MYDAIPIIRLNPKREENIMEKTKGKWSKEELKYLHDNFDCKTYPEIANVLKRTVGAVRVKASKEGLRQPSKYVYDSDYFECIDNNDKAYWLGFISADGYVIDN